MHCLDKNLKESDSQTFADKYVINVIKKKIVLLDEVYHRLTSIKQIRCIEIFLRHSTAIYRENSVIILALSMVLHKQEHKLATT